ncbi:T9SS type A sorting domain-containing protein [Dysgonomonas sp. HGC4]|nr:T9SS type A sorting domain-containing protein [Dysgonomonas sp. HGC4]
MLIDKYLNIEQDLSSNNVYRFNQRKTESERQYSDVNRFSLRLSSATSGIIDEPNSEDLIRVTYLTSQLEVSSEQGLNQIDVYDLQGRHMHTSGKLAGAPISYSKYLPLNQGVYIVKIKTSQGQIVAKKINAL